MAVRGCFLKNFAATDERGQTQILDKNSLKNTLRACFS